MGNVSLQAETPKMGLSKPYQIGGQTSSKREFEKLIIDIRNIAAKNRLAAGGALDRLVDESQANSNRQWWCQLLGNVVQMSSNGIAIAYGLNKAFNTPVDHYRVNSEATSKFLKYKLLDQTEPLLTSLENVAKEAQKKENQEQGMQSYQAISKISDLVGAMFNLNQTSYQHRLQKMQQDTAQWNAYASGLQQIVQNLDSGLQRLHQMEDAISH